MKNLFLLALVASLLSACGRIMLSSVVDKTLDKLTAYKHPDTEKTVVLVPMVHLGTEEYYNKIRLYLDSLKNDGYVTFFEGVKFYRDSAGMHKIHLLRKQDSLYADSLVRKCRRVVGMNIFGGYADPDNKSLPKALRDTKYVSQSIAILGLTSERDILVDLTLPEMISLYEKDKGEIFLTDNDFTTPLNAKYTLKDGKKYGSRYLLHTIRDNYLTNYIDTTRHQKIAVVYGMAHTDALKTTLRNELGFKKTKKLSKFATI